MCVETQVDQRFVHFRRDANRLADILAVSLDRTRNHALPESFNCAVKRRQRIGENFRAQFAWAHHAKEMREQAEARYVRAGRGAGLLHRFRRRLVQRGHRSFGGSHALRMPAPDLLAKCQDAGAQRLGQHQHVAGLRLFQRGGDLGIDQAGDGKAEFDLVILDAVPADERDASLFKNVHRAGQHLIHHLAR